MNVIIKIWGITLLTLFFVTNVFSQPILQKYWVVLKDKVDSPFSLKEPEAFLSSKAIARRRAQGIEIDEKDLPLSPKYLKEIRETGAKILHASRWFNAVTLVTDQTTLKVIAQLSFVQSVEYVGTGRPKKSPISSHRKSAEHDRSSPSPNGGNRQAQIKKMQGQWLHELGFHGQGKIIAVLDGGFNHLSKMPCFDSLRLNKQLLLGVDFVDGDHEVEEASSHGSKVLSIMGANIPDVMVGTATAATYVCIRTEDNGWESRYEECNWVVGAEYADSIGADIINTSLGYRDFSEAGMDYEAAALDGQTSIASQAANVASEKGILVIASAGNDGQSKNPQIGVPADAFNVLTVGAANTRGEPASFSSYGSTADGRMKPEIVAPGERVAVASVLSPATYSRSGTSYAAPAIAGLAASLWSAFPNLSNQEIRAAIIESAADSDDWKPRSGAGMPNFQRAYQLLKLKNRFSQP